MQDRPIPAAESPAPMKLAPCLPLLLTLVLTGCATEVTHPTKSSEEMRVDIDQCTDWANRKYWMDPVAALLNAQDCLEEKGYRKGRAGFDAEVERTVHEDRVKKKQPTQPCAVPCRRKRD